MSALVSTVIAYFAVAFLLLTVSAISVHVMRAVQEFRLGYAETRENSSRYFA
ncbi:MAG: hypothetical protein Q3974_08460 [Rothia sp. (in: high G+C Gram-positive bacteria)]|nr:hypothetical protein [Rothia sp. (in: high G+C Gram-positive bacteria)]